MVIYLIPNTHTKNVSYKMMLTQENDNCHVELTPN